MRSLAQFSGSVAFQEPSVLGAPGIWSLEDAMRYQALGQWPVWTPPVLFTSGAQGCLIDLSDQTTLFQDAQGTVPVTTSGQPVGLALDQHLWGGRTLVQELERQPERRGDFTSTTDTGATPGYYDPETGSGVVTRDDGTQSSYVWLSGLNAANYYRITVESTGSGSIIIRTGGPLGINLRIVPRSVTETFYVRPFNLGQLSVTAGSTNTSNSFILHGIKEVPGNCASQATVAARPAFRDIGGVRYLESDGVDDALNITLPSGTYTRAYVNAAGVMTIDEAVAISGTENIMREQTIAGVLYIDRALTDSEKANLASYWGAAS